MPHRANVSVCSLDMSKTLSGNGARASSSLPGAIGAIRAVEPRARQMAAWKFPAIAADALTPRICARCNSSRTSTGGGPNSFSVPAMSMTQRKASPLLQSSTRGEKPHAHSSMAACAESSSMRERGSTISDENVSSSTLVIPRATPRWRAFALKEQAVSSGGSPSRMMTARSRNSGRRRRADWAGNSFA